MKVKEVIEIIERRYPLSLQEEWDHSGFQCGDREQEVKKIMIALDCDKRTIKEAVEKKCNLLITHHPLLFKEISLDAQTSTGEMISLAIKNSLSIYSSHTPLDKVDMNEWLIEKLPVKDISSPNEFVRSARLITPLGLKDFLKLVKETYSVEIIKYAGLKKEVQTISICGGSGSEFFLETDTDAYITGDTKYHIGEEAYNTNKLLIDVGHHIEKIMVPKLKAYLQERISVEIIESSSPDYYKFYL
ncbi:Nif3-like dinuclear metal center hexameric protein [Eggerthia catenaformis]|uniref:Nif3-like dinuclear metal center hexameric protein n=1 Tax=Eggerthia catenaformis TaxID=31973 RepID=UPI00248E6C04|nr:Nif3-like dinuclear metal center hexameric protein [Eggerthia catenaformis]